MAEKSATHARRLVATVVSLLLVSGAVRAQAVSLPIGANVDTALGLLIQMHRQIRGIHPTLGSLHPIAVLEGDSLFIFDADSAGTAYRFQRSEHVPFPMQKGIRASFPLAGYGNTPTCVVSSEVFDSPGGYATVFHEFVHCSQALTGENDLKQELHVARAAAAARDYSWEINHPFPYNDTAFIAAYAGFLHAPGDHDSLAVLQSARDLKRCLAQDDIEYMVWVEWKEGFARYIENIIRLQFRLAPNLAGRDRPFDRVTFYYGGEQLISYIAARHGGTLPDLRALFRELLALHGSR